jgi:SnoaL-like protein
VALSNVDIVLANSEAFNRRDAEGMLRLWGPEATMADRRAVGWGVYSGRDALASYYQGLFDNLAAVHEDLSVVSAEECSWPAIRRAT